MSDKIALNFKKNISAYVTDWLRDEIRSGAFGKDGMLPSEEELSQKIGVSRPTVRTALATLSAEGYLVRKQGNGTFINTGGIEVLSYQSTWEFTRLIEESGRKASIELHSVAVRGPTETEKDTLNLSDSDEVFSVQRVFLGDDNPVIYSENIFNRKFYLTAPEDYPFWLPTPEFFEKECGIRQAYNFVDVSALDAPKFAAELLHIAENTPILLFDEIFYDADFNTLFCAKNYCNDKKIRIRFAQKRG